MIVFVLSGCGGSSHPPEPTAPSATATPPVENAGGEIPTEIPPPTEVVAGELVWATAVEAGTNRPAAEVAEFDVTVPILFAVVPVSAAPAGSTLSATWTYNATPIQGMDVTVQLPEVRTEPVWVEFHLDRQVGEEWPDGEYRVTVRSGDRVVAEGSVVVDPA